jgi:hypothetical protein
MLVVMFGSIAETLPPLKRSDAWPVVKQLPEAPVPPGDK